MFIAMQEASGSEIVSGLAALALAWLTRNAWSIRRYVFDLLAKADRVANAVDVIASKIKKIDRVLELIGEAKNFDDLKNGMTELRNVILPIIAAAQTLAQETRDGDSKT